jgi:IS5 family transposase
MSFLKMEAKTRIKKDNHLLKIDRIINWSFISSKIKGIHKNEVDPQGGQKAYDNLQMFKATLLGQWHSLSDTELEEALSLRLDFMLFTGLEGDVPDSTTLCRFRNKLIELKLDKILFEEINRQLKQKGFKLKGTKGAVIDATLIESANRPNKIIEIANDREEDTDVENTNNSEDSNNQQLTIKESKDPDAKWLKKGNKSYFGYKGFISVESDTGFIEKVKVEPANVSEVGKFGELMSDIEADTVYADKGYASAENVEILKNKKIRNGIMARASRGHPLTVRQKQRNKILSKTRYIVEQTFGTLKRLFKFTRASYKTTLKVEGQMRLKAMCLNLLKASNMVAV